MADQNQESIANTLRRELYEEGILHDGDSIGTDDETLLRFLRARKFDLRQAKKMIVDAQHWRRTVEGVGIDVLYRQVDPFDYPGRDAVFECWPIWYHKTDKEGRPINIQSLSKVNVPKLYKHIAPEEHWKSLVVNSEALVRELYPAASKQAGKPISTSLCIVDLKGFGLSQFWQMSHLVRMSFQMSQDYYPETMGKIAVINAPSSFTLIWPIVKPWISKETAAKVDILGSNYRAVLLSLVDAENLPKVLGGKCTCGEGDGERCQFSSAGPWQEGRVGWGPNAKKAKEEHQATQPNIDRVSLELEKHMATNENECAVATVEACA